MDINTLPKGHIIGWEPPTSTSTSGSPSTKSAKKNARKKAKKIAQRRDEEEEGDVSEKQSKEEDVPENWEDDDESGPQGSNSGIPDTNPSITTTTDPVPAKEIQQVSPADVERDLSSKLDKLNVK
jgi:partner of Y14 and mago